MKQILASGAVMMTMWSLISAAPANAAYPDGQSDFFGRTTAPTPSPAPRPSSAPTRIQAGVQHTVVRPAPWVGPRPQVSDSSTANQWFEAVDSYVGYFRPTNADAVIVDTPFNQEVERVEQFCRTMVKISRNYRILAKRISSMPVPMSVPEARQYRDMYCTWYNDQAQLYEDLVRPRKPARTKEELAAVMNELKDRSESLTEQFARLQQMDMDVRKKLGVHAPRYDDALHDYATRDMPAHIKQQLDSCQH